MNTQESIKLFRDAVENIVGRRPTLNELDDCIQLDGLTQAEIEESAKIWISETGFTREVVKSGRDSYSN